MSAAKTRPTLKGDSIERVPVAQAVLEDPQYVVVRDSSEYVVAWARIGDEQALTLRDYRFVSPDELEAMPPGSYIPQDKDFGVWFYFEKDDNRVRQGDSVLMKVRRDLRDARVAREQARAESLAPSRDKSIEQANYELGDAVRLKDELKG